MSEPTKKPEEVAQIDFTPPKQGWMEKKVEFKKGSFNYAYRPDNWKYLGLPFARKWQPMDEDWKLPENWQQK